jgi:uncharacterized protein YcfJ
LHLDLIDTVTGDRTGLFSLILQRSLMMKRARIGIIATAVLAVATMAFAQAKADFSGSWAPEVDPAAAAPTAGGGGGRGGMMAGPMTVKQTADTLTVERTVGENKVVAAYKLDGTESNNSQMGRGGNTMEVKSTVKWDGPKLVITSKRPGQDGAMVETTATWSLAGGVLTVENAGGRGPSKTTYKKTT